MSERLSSESQGSCVALRRSLKGERGDEVVWVNPALSPLVVVLTPRTHTTCSYRSLRALTPPLVTAIHPTPSRPG